MSLTQAQIERRRRRFAGRLKETPEDLVRAGESVREWLSEKSEAVRLATGAASRSGPIRHRPVRWIRAIRHRRDMAAVSIDNRRCAVRLDDLYRSGDLVLARRAWPLGKREWGRMFGDERFAKQLRLPNTE